MEPSESAIQILDTNVTKMMIATLEQSPNALALLPKRGLRIPTTACEGDQSGKVEGCIIIMMHVINASQLLSDDPKNLWLVVNYSKKVTGEMRHSFLKKVNPRS